MPRRGSFTWASRWVATICLIRPARRRARPASTIAISLELAEVLVIEDPGAGGQQFDLRTSGDEPFAVDEYLAHLRMIPAHHSDRHFGPPMQLLVARLRDAHVEATPQVGHHRPHDRPLLLQRVDVAEQHV